MSVFGLPVHEKIFTKFYTFLPLIGASPLIFTKLNSHSPKMLPTKFSSNQFDGFEELAF